MIKCKHVHNCLGSELWREWNQWAVKNNGALGCFSQGGQRKHRGEVLHKLRSEMKRSQERAQGEGSRLRKQHRQKAQGGKELGTWAGWRGCSWPKIGARMNSLTMNMAVVGLLVNLTGSLSEYSSDSPIDTCFVKNLDCLFLSKTTQSAGKNWW